MAKETIAELSAKLKIDLSELEGDFALADKTVSQAMSKLNHESKKLRIQTDIDLTALGNAGSKVERLHLQEKSLTAQLELQRQKVNLVNAAYLRMVEIKGQDSAASAKLETRLLNERKNLELLRAELGKVHAVQNAKPVGTAQKIVNSIANGATMGQVALQGADALGLMTMAKSPVGMAAAAGMAMATGMYKASTAAAANGVALDKLATKLHTTTAEAARMKKVFALAGADVGTAVPAIIRLDKAIMSAGADGNDTTRMLDRFGVKLTDAQGNLLPVTQQLQKLAEGYKQAAFNGQETEYATQLLGARGAELIPVLANMTELLSRAAAIPSTGLLDVNQSKELIMTEREMSMAMGQLKGVMGALFMPIVTTGVEGLTAAIEAMVGVAKDAKDPVSGVADAMDGIKVHVKDAKDNINDFVDALMRLKDEAANSDIVVHISQITDYMEKASGGARAGLQSEGLGNREYGSTANDTYQQEVFEAKKKAMQRERMLKGMRQYTQEDLEKLPEKVYDPATGRGIEKAALSKEEEKAAAATAKINSQVSDSLYKATHSDLENSLHEIDQRAEKLKAEGASEKEIVRLSEAEKAKIYRDFNDNTLSQIQKSWKSALQNRLDDIEREKRAWIQKGVDEVTATKWAEREKGKARQQAGLEALKQQRKYLDIYRQAMQGPGTAEQKAANAKMGILNAMRQQYGVQNERMTPQELMGFTDAMSAAKNNLIPGLEVDSWARELAKNSVSVYRGAQEYHDIPGITTNITVEGGVFTDNDTINRMTSTVADRVNNTISKVVNAANYSYDTGG